MEKCLYTSEFNIEGESGEEETPGGIEDEEGKWGNGTHIDRQQGCETIHTSRILDAVAPSAHNLKCLYTCEIALGLRPSLYRRKPLSQLCYFYRSVFVSF